MKTPQTFYTIDEIKNEHYHASKKIRARIIHFYQLYNGTDIIESKEYKSKRRAIAKSKQLSKEFGYPFLKDFKYFNF